MSLKKNVTRRLGLLAGSSLMAGLIGAVLAPSMASAQAVCAPAPSTGDGTNTVTYSAATYNPGITCTASGGAMNVSTTGAITVSATDPTPLVDDSGVNLVGGTQNVTWTSTAGAVTGGASINGPVIDVTTSTGAINIATAGVVATAAGATHAIRATATGAGNITVTRAPGGAINNNSAGSLNAIELVSEGGNIVYSDSGGGATTGRLRGVLARTSGSGSVSITKGGGNINTTATSDAVAALDVITGTGGFNLLMTGVLSINQNGAAIPAIRVVSTGGATITAQAGEINGRVDFSGVTGSGVTMNLTGAGRWTVSGSSIFSALGDVVTVNSTGGNTLSDGGAIDFGAGADRLLLAGSLTNSYTAGAGTIAFGSGADRLDVTGRLASTGTLIDMGVDADIFDVDGEMVMRSGSTIQFGDGADLLDISGRVAAFAGALNFGADTDTLNMSGELAVETLTIAGLETFNNSGVILMGALLNQAQTEPAYGATDGGVGDRLIMSGGTFTGSDNGRVVMDILIGLDTQVGCDTAPIADCLDLRGASTAGETLITLNNIAPPATLGGFNPVGVTLVDVGGAGTSGAGHFVLDPDNALYVDDPAPGAGIDRPGLFLYVLQYDPGSQRHVLVGLPKSQAMEYAMLSGAVQSIWHMTTETVNDRQNDLRAGSEGGALWMRTAGEYTRRDVDTTLATPGGTLAFDNGYKLYAGTIMVGSDLIVGSSGGYDYALGFQAGYVTSSFDLNEQASSGRLTGGTGGVYGSVWSDRFFLDGVLNINGLTLDYDSPGLHSKTNTYVNSVGARLEGGMRWMLTERTFVEPLATMAFARTSFEEISLFGGEVAPADAKAQRGALGLRLGADLTEGPVNVGYFVAGRAWNEFDGESTGAVRNPGVELPFSDAFSGEFGEAEAGISLFNDDGALSGFLSSGVKFKDGYNAVNFALGMQMTW